MRPLNNQLLTAAANAKVNLYLHVTGRHQNGYHLLDSLVVFPAIGDTVEITPASSVKITLAGEYGNLLDENDNSVLRAAEALRKHYGIKNGAAITLHKNLPIGAGIGGGSADAAATVKLLLRLWKIDASPKELMAIGLLLGADVPACLQSTSLYMNGIGEIIEAAPKLPGLYILLVNTGKPLLTKDVFAHYKSGQFLPPAAHPKQFASSTDLLEYLRDTRNDLQATATGLQPEIAEVIRALDAEKNCLLARMSGSGATCFGLFAKRKFAEDAALRIGQQHPSWWIRTAAVA